jgi:hypothetical protein
MLSVIYAECRLCWVSFMLSVIYAELCWVLFMLSVTNKSIMLSVIMLNIIMLNVLASWESLSAYPNICGYHFKPFCLLGSDDLDK